MAKSTFLQKAESYKRRRGRNPTLATPGYRDHDPVTINDYAAMSPLKIGKLEPVTGPFPLNPPKKRKPRA
jgi:hypothetical protein